jgi:aspartate aminotransferase
VDVIDLSLGEPDFNTPEHIKEAAKKAIDEDYSHYTPVAGYPDLREAVCTKLKRDNNLEYKPENIIVSNGAKHSIANLVMALVDAGDEVIIPIPYWVTYSEIVKLNEGIPVMVSTSLEDGFKITPQQLEDAITPKTKLFMFSSPNNPTGCVYSKEELTALAEVFKKHPGIYIMSDEIYEYINFVGKHESIAQFDYLKERVVIVNGLSKGYAMTGYRLGYIAASPDIVKACEKLQGQITSGINAVTQRAAIVALTSELASTHKMVEEFERRKHRVLELMKQVPDIELSEPDGAFYIFPRISQYFGRKDGEDIINNADDLCMYLLNKAHVSTVTGRAFGAPDCIRISFANSMEKIEEGYKRIIDALARLN